MAAQQRSLDEHQQILASIVDRKEGELAEAEEELGQAQARLDHAKQERDASPESSSRSEPRMSKAYTTLLNPLSWIGIARLRATMLWKKSLRKVQVTLAAISEALIAEAVNG